jgi:sterol 3beta-glucosyltransferase
MFIFAVVRSRIYRNVASSGYFVVTPHHIAFWSKSFTQADIRYRIPLSTVKSAKPFDPKLIRINGVVVEIAGHADLRFTFKSHDVREKVLRRINGALEADEATLTSSLGGGTPSSIGSPTTSTNSLHPNATDILSPLSRTIATAMAIGLPPSIKMLVPKAINIPREMLVNRPSRHYMCLTIGSRGDVQPYIALGLGLMKEGHRVTIVTHEEYKEWIVGFGIEHRTAGGDPGALMKLSVENKVCALSYIDLLLILNVTSLTQIFSPDFFRESLSNFRPWLEQRMFSPRYIRTLFDRLPVLVDSWEACQDADVLLESPSAMAGVHIAEALSEFIWDYWLSISLILF